MICHELKILYINICRNASSSVGRALINTFKDYEFVVKHHSFSDVCLPPPKGVIGKYRSFSVVRNPYDRAVSMWLFNQNKRRVSFIDFLTSISNNEYKNKPRDYSMRSGVCKNWFQIPQTDWVIDSCGKNRVDKIIHYENLIKDIDRLCKEWNIPKLNIPKINTSEQRSGEKRLPWKHYYNKKSIYIVNNIFKKDFETFGYKLTI